MKAVIIEDTVTGADLIIDPPYPMPAYSLGTLVTFRVMKEDSYDTMDGEIVSCNINHEVDLTNDDTETLISYRVVTDKNEVLDILEDDIMEYYPETNQCDVAYHRED